jgi:hypothetical protein
MFDHLVFLYPKVAAQLGVCHEIHHILGKTGIYRIGILLLLDTL